MKLQWGNARGSRGQGKEEVKARSPMIQARLKKKKQMANSGERKNPGKDER